MMIVMRVAIKLVTQNVHKRSTRVAFGYKQSINVRLTYGTKLCTEKNP